MAHAARGKVILLGDHAVAHGRPALVAALERGVRAQVVPGEPGLHVEGALMPVDSDLGRAFGALCHAAGRAARVQVFFDVPVSAGLGSSAAVAVAVARALGVPEERIFEVAQVSERIFHGAPSGVDVEAARRGGVGWFTRQAGWRDVHAQPFTLCVGLSGRARSTREMVARVGALIEREPARGHALFDAISALVERGRAALERGDGAELGRLFEANHAHLGELGVGAPELDELCTHACAAGALGAKLTGAGGGGAVIAVAPGREAAVLNAWRGAGYDGFLARIPCTQ